MSAQCAPTTRFIFHALDESLAEQLRQAASGSGQHVFYSAASTSECLALAERLHADTVFCNSEPLEYRQLLSEVKRRGLRLPVIVVSRLPEISEWLDAVEAGAVDYCAAPFEHQHLSWLIQSALLYARPAA
jgi:DNA-binding NtrC family response regulator